MLHGLCDDKKFMFELTETSDSDKCAVSNDLEHLMIKFQKYERGRLMFPVIKQSDTLVDLLKEKNVKKYRAITAFYWKAKLDF